jgi:hypothetical protein
MASGPERLAVQLDRRLAAVREPRMRAGLVREAISELDAPALCALFAHVLRRPAATRGAVDWLREQLHALLAGGAEPPVLTYERRAELYACARAQGEQRIVELLRLPGPRPAGEEFAEQAPFDLREIPLGRRRSLARRRDPVLLEKLARDADAGVIANLLANPRTTEDDVVRMAALRPVPPSTLLEIACSARWARQARVRRALARNPDCPAELALRLLPSLERAALREICAGSAVDPLLRTHARQELERRRRRPAG